MGFATLAPAPRDALRRILVQGGQRLSATLGLFIAPLGLLPRGMRIDTDLRRILAGKRDLCIFDVGANVGQTSAFFRKAFPHAPIHAFEPIPSTFAELKAQAARLGGVHPHQLALGNAMGQAMMEIGEQSGWSRIVSEPGASPSTRLTTVPLVRLDEFCRNNAIAHIDILKVDCEGYDFEVLEGAQAMLADNRVSCVYSEVDFQGDGKHGDFYRIDALLRNAGFTFYGLYEYSSWQYDVTTEGFMNALWVRSGLLIDNARRRRR